MQSGNDTNTSNTTTPLVEVTAWNTENEVHFMVHDLGGHEAYANTLSMFLTEPKAFYLLVYDHYRYTQENFHYHIGRWLDLLQIYVPGAVVKPVGTHIDRCRRGQAAEHLRVIQEQMMVYEEERVFRIDQQIEVLEGVINGQLNHNIMFDLKTDTTDPLYNDSLEQTYHEVSIITLKVQLKQLIKERSSEAILRIQDISLIGSAEDMRGILSLTNDIEVMAVNLNLFPHAQRYICPAWQAIRQTIRQLPGPYTSKRSIVSLVSQQRKNDNVGNSEEDEQTADHIIKFMCLTGEVLCLKHIPKMKSFIFHRPQVLYNQLKGLFRHDINALLDYKTNRVFKCRSQFTPESFEETRSSMLKKGQISRALLVCLWFYRKYDYDEFNAAVELMPKLDVCYLIPQPSIPGPRSTYIPMMVLPWCISETRSSDISDLWPVEVPMNMKQIEVMIKFPTYHPIDVFEQLSCRLHEHLDLRIDWKDLVFGQVDDVFLLLHKRTAASNDDILQPQKSPSLTRCSSATSKDGVEGILTVTNDVIYLSQCATPVAPMTTENIQKLNEENMLEESAHYQNPGKHTKPRPRVTDSEHKSESETETEKKDSTRSRRNSGDTTISERSESHHKSCKRSHEKKSISGSSATWVSSKQPLRPERPGPAMIVLKLRGANVQTMQTTLLYYHQHVTTLLAARPGLPYYMKYNAINCENLTKEECIPTEFL